MRKSLPQLLCGVLALLAVYLVALRSRALPGPENPAGFAAVYARGVVRLAMPFEAPRSGAGRLVTEIVDPEDRVLASTARQVYLRAGQGTWHEEMVLVPTLPLDELVWHRVRYRFRYQDTARDAVEGALSISRILRQPAIRVLGPATYLAGSSAAVQLIVTEGDEDETPVASGTVRVELRGPGEKSRVLSSGKLNARGTARLQLQFPAAWVGRHSLRYVVDTALGVAEHTQPITLEDKSAILLSTEKPLYQPGQTIHVRALALDRANHQAVAARKLTFELEDSRGNKVFRKITRTDGYGVASAEFALADEVNLGTYHLRAVVAAPGESAESKSEIALEVAKYVLPRFKVAVELAAGAAKRGYRPGDRVTGTVRANYFFGKPVDGAEVRMRVAGADAASLDSSGAQGRTDRDGAFRFDIRLPHTAGRGGKVDAGRVMLEATVKDTAGHDESGTQAVTVSDAPLLITVVPEGGTLIPNIENEVFVLTAYPDGMPAETSLRVTMPDRRMAVVNTDAGGVAVVRVPGASGTILGIQARDQEGNQASVRVPLDVRAGADQILLRTERSVFRAGETMRLAVLSTRRSSHAYIDLIQDGQIVGTHDVELADGRARLDVVMAPAMAGALEVNAYMFGRGARPVSDHRLVFVQPADELRIETALDQPVYQPGAEARIGFRVTNHRGEGVQAALGLEIVDQAVFALAQKQPGFAKLFFHLEQEALKPRLEIPARSLSDAITSTEREKRELAARALFSATEMVRTRDALLKFGEAIPQTKYAAYARRYKARLDAQINRLVADIGQENDPNGVLCDPGILRVRLQGAELVDPWGNAPRVEQVSWFGGYFIVRSAGPDEQFYSADDLTQDHYDVRCTVFVRREPRSIRMRSERDASLNGQSSIAGVVLDPSGAVLPGADLTLTETTSDQRRAQASAANGTFSFAGVAPGRYELQASMAGFQTTVVQVNLNQSEHTTVEITLEVGSVSQSVLVTAEAPLVQTTTAAVSAVGGGRNRRESRAASPRKMEVQELPASERNFQQLALAAPGAMRDAAQPVPETHVRSWFPEALYISPQIITDAEGRANISIPIADNITTWRMDMLASTKRGALGSGTAEIKVLQDFFAELDLPVVLTQGDEVTLPVAVYNYSGAPGAVRLELERSDWFAAAGDTLEKSLHAESGRVTGAQFVIEARRIGKFQLTLKAAMSGQEARADIVVREIEVIPNGREQTQAFNGRLDGAVAHNVDFPADAVADAGKIFVRIYPSPLSQVVEGMDAVLSMPYGCFEQTSSATYPNVLALDYMKRIRKLTPEIHAKAEGFISKGYQRLLTFEVRGGGFSWFGDAPANKVLTSYGLMEFSDMSKVYDVDPKLIERTQRWLTGEQQADGSWQPDRRNLHDGATNRYDSDVLRITAYIAWALVNTGYEGPAVEQAYRFISTNRNKTTDAYTSAVIANFAVDYKKDRDFARRAIQQLVAARAEQGDHAWWTSEETAVFGQGASAAIETTGLAVQALLKSGESPAVTRKALSYIASKKEASGTWGTTQATIMALRALLLSAEKGSADVRGTVEVTLNGKPAATLDLTAQNSDLFHQFVFKGDALRAANDVALRFQGEGTPSYQVASQHFVPWNTRGLSDPFAISIDYDRTRLTEGEVISAAASVKNLTSTTANMVMIDLGIPPGFELLSEDLEDFREKTAGRKSGRLEKFTLSATQAMLYFGALGARDTVKVRYRLRAKYPIHARTIASRVYEYYDPAQQSVARPVELQVRARR